MRSAYGFEIPEPDLELAQVGPGTPGGELLRRYWHPICTSEDLQDLPKRVRILGEDLVAFRDGRGRPGLLFPFCSHRATSLEYGRIEERGLRCCYHGWLYDFEGRILDMPLEPPGSTFKDRIEHPCYPVEEYGGLVFAYLGPLEKKPLLPKYDIWQQGPGTLTARVGPRPGGSVNCNWLQTQENLMDAAHLMWLHIAHSGSQFPSELYAIPPQVEYVETDMGMKMVMTRNLPDGREWELTWEVVMPFTTHIIYDRVPNVDARGGSIEKMRRVSFCIPVDDTRQLGANIEWVPFEDEERLRVRRDELGPAGRTDTSYEYTQRRPDDKEATEGQGPIANRRLEHLATSDRGAILFRNILRQAIKDVAAARDPKGVLREPTKAACVATHGGSIIRCGSVVATA